MNRVINILGTEYEIIFTGPEEDVRLKDSLGYCDMYSKKIVIDNDPVRDSGQMAIDVPYELKEKALRHEIIHAFLSESGLRECSDWAQNEEMVDWFAVMFEKLNDAYFAAWDIMFESEDIDTLNDDSDCDMCGCDDCEKNQNDPKEYSMEAINKSIDKLWEALAHINPIH